MEKQLKSAFLLYIDSYFVKRNPEETLSILSKKICGVGTGKDEIGRSHETFWNLYLRDFEQAPNPIKIDFDFIDVHPLSKDIGVVFSKFNLKTEIENQHLEIFNLRLSLVFSKTEGSWVIIHKHISLPFEEQKNEESYPIEELERKNKELQNMVERQTHELIEKNKSLQKALDDISKLETILPICSFCKKIRDTKDEWTNVDHFVKAHKIAEVTHSVCPNCLEENYPETARKKKK